LICEQAGNTLGLPHVSIEKDFWVCWILREMFSIPGWGDNLTFKGGTSLSKCWGLIKRFSEDIDLVIDKGFLGFGSGERPEDAPSIKGGRFCKLQRSMGGKTVWLNPHEACRFHGVNPALGGPV
jgi:hypothetical protein